MISPGFDFSDTLLPADNVTRPSSVLTDTLRAATAPVESGLDLASSDSPDISVTSHVPGMGHYGDSRYNPWDNPQRSFSGYLSFSTTRLGIMESIPPLIAPTLRGVLQQIPTPTQILTPTPDDIPETTPTPRSSHMEYSDDVESNPVINNPNNFVMIHSPLRLKTQTDPVT